MRPAFDSDRRQLPEVTDLGYSMRLNDETHQQANMKPGRYRHFKGKDYIVLGVARHSETEEELVVYRQDYGDHGLWVRPKQMFLESVEVDGLDMPRFEFIADADE